MTPFISALSEQLQMKEVNLNEAQVGQLGAHFELMTKWNKTHNLTRIVDGAAAAEKHYLDCLVGLDWVPDKVIAHDFGSGAGFPGLVAAIARPHQRFVLVEPARKRASFLERAIKSIGLPNVSVAHCRAQETGDVDLVISRGTFSWPNFQPLVAPLRNGGQLVLWLGHTPTETEFHEGLGQNGLETEWFSYELPISGLRHMGRATKTQS